MMRPWLWLPARFSHALSSVGVEAAAWLAPASDTSWKPVRWKGIEFKNPLGTAGGLDKNAEHVQAWTKLGAGFIEVGTVTPKPQAGNPGVVIGRSVKHQALWNRMGFPSKGSDFVLEKVTSLSKKETPLFINIGKNREHSLENAGADSFKLWLKPVIAASGSTPVLLKLSPDMSEEDFKATVQMAVEEGISGFILTNTTLSRSPDLPFPAEGGVSGLPLRDRSLQSLELIQRILGSQRSSLLIVSCGGVMTAEDVFDRLNRGADLVQAYSALVFSGPGFLKDVAQKWKTLNPRRQG